MKKMYIICLFLLVAIVSAIGSYYFTVDYLNRNSQYNHEKQYELNPMLAERKKELSPLTEKEEKINNLTKIVIQNYYEKEEKMVEEEINTPVAFLEMTKEDMLSYIKEYLAQKSQEYPDFVDFELVTFSNELVVLRKTFANSKQEDGYYAVNENGYVVIYYQNGNNYYDFTNIAVEKLPEIVQKQIKKGISFQNLEEVYDFVQTYSS